MFLLIVVRHNTICTKYPGGGQHQKDICNPYRQVGLVTYIINCKANRSRNNWYDGKVNLADIPIKFLIVHCLVVRSYSLILAY